MTSQTHPSDMAVLVERLRAWSAYSYHETHHENARALFGEAADAIEALSTDQRTGQEVAGLVERLRKVADRLSLAAEQMPEDFMLHDVNAVDEAATLLAALAASPVPVDARGALAARAIRAGVKSLVESQARQWFCSGDDCTEYDSGRDEGLRLALRAIDCIDISKALHAAPAAEEKRDAD